VRAVIWTGFNLAARRDREAAGRAPQRERAFALAVSVLRAFDRPAGIEVDNRLAQLRQAMQPLLSGEDEAGLAISVRGGN
jgi:hypothetical protein